MAEIKKLWLVSDAPKVDGNLDYLWEDPSMNGEDHRLAHFCGALQEGGYSVDQFAMVYAGGGKRVLSEHPKASLAKSVVARFKGASTYDHAFQTMVQVVDDLEAASKKIPKALDALKDLKEHAAKDPDVAGQPGLNKHAPEQQIGFLTDKFEAAQKAVENLVEQYEDSNQSFLRMKLR